LIISIVDICVAR